MMPMPMSCFFDLNRSIKGIELELKPTLLLHPLTENFEPTLETKICAFQDGTGADFGAKKQKT